MHILPTGQRMNLPGVYPAMDKLDDTSVPWSVLRSGLAHCHVSIQLPVARTCLCPKIKKGWEVCSQGIDCPMTANVSYISVTMRKLFIPLANAF